jgi:hypothetical protein
VLTDQARYFAPEQAARVRYVPNRAVPPCDSDEDIPPWSRQNSLGFVLSASWAGCSKSCGTGVIKTPSQLS